MPGYNTSDARVSGIRAWVHARTGPGAEDLVSGSTTATFNSTGAAIDIIDLAPGGTPNGLKAWDLNNSLQHAISMSLSGAIVSGSTVTMHVMFRRDGSWGNNQFAGLAGVSGDPFRGTSLSIEQNGTGSAWNGYALVGKNTGSWHQGAHGGTANTSATWYGFGMTYDGALGSANLKLFRNGVAIGTPTTSVGTIRAADVGTLLRIGNHYSQPWYFNGAIADVTIFDVAKSDAEMLAWYNSALAGHADILTGATARSRVFFGGRLRGPLAP
jgi:hypothetical protein